MIRNLIQKLRKAFPDDTVAVGFVTCIPPSGKQRYQWTITYNGNTLSFAGYKDIIRHIKSVLDIVAIADEEKEESQCDQTPLEFAFQELKKYGVTL